MILDSVQGLNDVHRKLKEFIASTETALRLEADTWGNPQPYDEFLPNLEFKKTDGPIFVSFNEDRGIKVAGSVENLEIYTDFFQFAEDEDTDHHHPEYVLDKEDYIAPGTLSLIIEADNYYIQEHQYES